MHGYPLLVGPPKGCGKFPKARGTFEEANTAFSDPLSITVPDPDHSLDESRFLLVGRSTRQRLVVVVHAEREAPKSG